MANQTGVGFAMASEWRARGSFNQDDLAKSLVAKKESPANSQMIIIAVLALILMGLILSLANANGSLAGLLGLVATAGLIYFMTDLKNDFNANMKKDAVDQAEQGARDVGLNGMVTAINDTKPSLAFTQWFWIAVVVLLAAAVFSWQRRRSMT